MAQQYSRELLRRTVAHVCQLIGWHAIHAGPLDVLVHVLEKYLLTLATQAQRHAEHGSRTQPTLADLARAFREAGVRLSELRQYARAVPACPPALRPPPYPLPGPDRLAFLKPGSAEVLTRPVHVHEHLPPMLAPRPEPEPEPEDDKRFKRPVDPVSAAKKPRRSPADDCHARELSSVMMTVSGFLSPAREGKLPEARTPVVVPDVPLDRKPDAGPTAALPDDRPPRPDKKSRKSKAPNGKIEKTKKKDKNVRRLLDKHVNLENKVNKITSQASRIKMPPIPKNHVAELSLSDRPPPLFHPDVPIKVPKREADVEPVAKSAEGPGTPSFANDVPRPSASPESVPPIVIKEEKVDPEKLTSQPDRLKLDIFKKISTKPKEEKPPDPFKRIAVDGVAIKVERSSPEPPSRVPAMPLFKRRSPPVEARPSSAIDLTSRRGDPSDLGETFDPTKRKIKSEPPDDPPAELPRPKLSLVPSDVLTGTPKRAPKMTAKEKREKKQKEKRLKEERVMREYRKLLKDRPELTERFEAPDRFDPASVRFPFPFPMSDVFANFQGGLPTPGLIPNRNAFQFPPFRGMRPPSSTAAPNPFSIRGGGPASGGFLPVGPGLIPPGLINPHLAVNHAFGQPPNIPAYLRRPSLEVIPIKDDDESRSKPARPFVNSALSIKEREKPKGGFLPDRVNATISATIKQSPSPKANPIIQVAPVRPDVTIELNAPVEIKPAIPPIERAPSPSVPKEKDKSEKKKDKPHKKEKKDREQKIKKKKDKKDKLKLKLERKKEKEEKQESKDKIKKEKKEKRKDKEKRPFGPEGVVPKLTLKLGPASPMLPPSPDATKKLNIKPIVRKDEPSNYSPAHIVPAAEIKRSQSPELVQFSALYTRPPKVKSSKHNSVRPDSAFDGNNSASSPPSLSDNSSPARKSKPPSSHAKHKRIVFKHVPKRNSGDFDDPIIDLASEDAAPDEPENVPDVPLGTPYYMDSKGERVWICPGCGRPDNGTPMIGCDGCDAWYHWVCVGIHVPPEDEVWYCKSCIAKRTAQASAQAAGHVGKKRGRKPKADKLKEKII